LAYVQDFKLFQKNLISQQVKEFSNIWLWTRLVPENYWASRNNVIGLADPLFAQSINIVLAHDPQQDKAGPSLHASIGTRASRLRRSLDRPTNKKLVFPLPKG
jgi:hypothetical protein